MVTPGRMVLFFFTHTTHPVALESQSQFCHLPAGNKFHISRALKTEQTGCPAGFFCRTVVQIFPFDADKPKPAHSRVQLQAELLLSHVTGMLVTLDSYSVF